MVTLNYYTQEPNSRRPKPRLHSRCPLRTSAMRQIPLLPLATLSTWYTSFVNPPSLMLIANMKIKIGPDVPSRSNPTSRNVRHYLAGNLTLSSQNSSVLATASLLSNSSAATNEYAAPAPSAGTGSHRYVYLLYTQPAALNSKSFASLGFNASARTGFNVSIPTLSV